MRSKCYFGTKQLSNKKYCKYIITYVFTNLRTLTKVVSSKSLNSKILLSVVGIFPGEEVSEVSEKHGE